MKTPGEILKEALTLAGMSQKDLADRTGIDPSRISKFIRNRMRYKEVHALLFEQALPYIPAEFWMEKDGKYYLTEARNDFERRR